MFFFEPRILHTAPEFVMPSPNRTFLLFVPNLAFWPRILSNIFPSEMLKRAAYSLVSPGRHNWEEEGEEGEGDQKPKVTQSPSTWYPNVFFGPKVILTVRGPIAWNIDVFGPPKLRPWLWWRIAIFCTPSVGSFVHHFLVLIVPPLRWNLKFKCRICPPPRCQGLLSKEAWNIFQPPQVIMLLEKMYVLILQFSQVINPDTQIPVFFHNPSPKYSWKVQCPLGSATLVA